MKRRINFVYLIGLLTLGAALVGGAYWLRAYQIQRQAPILLKLAEAAEAAGDLPKAVNALRLYLAAKPRDVEAWVKYARLMDQTTEPGPGRDQVYLFYKQALQLKGEDDALERRCAELAFELRRYDDARTHLDHLIPGYENDPSRAQTAAELEELMGRCQYADKQYDKAEDWYRQAIDHDPERITAHENLAALLRLELKKPDQADLQIQAMLDANPDSAEALTARWRYRRKFGIAADPDDIRRALALSPENADVLAAAVQVAGEANDLEQARAHIARGTVLFPKNRIFYVLGARLESSEGKLDQAEALLRQAVKTLPDDFELNVLLTEALIGQGKIDGDDGAGASIKKLASAGLNEGYLRYLEARVSIRQENWRGAVESLNSARALLADDPVMSERLELLLAECQGRLGAEPERLAALERAGKIQAGGRLALPLLAEALEKAGRIEDALKVHLELEATRPESHFDEVRLLIQHAMRQPPAQRSWDAVEARLKDAEQALPDDVERATLLRVDLLAAQGRGADGRKVLEDAIRREPKQLAYRLALAGQLTQGREPEDAEPVRAALAVLDQAEKDLGPSPALELAKIEGASLLPANEAAPALAGFAEKLDRAPAADRPALLNRLATAYERVGDLAKSGQYLKTLSALAPNDMEILRRRADLALTSDDKAQAEEIAGLIRTIEGEPGVVWRYVAAESLISQIAQGDGESRGPLRAAAASLTAEILSRRQDWWGGLVLRGQLAEMEGKLEDAARDYSRALDQGATQPLLARRTVMLLSQLGHDDRVDQLVQKLAERGPAFDELKLAMARNALRRQDYERAVVLSREVVSDSSRSYLDLLFLGEILTKAGRYAEADKPLSRAIELAPNVGTVWIERARFLTASGRRGEIPQLLEKAARSLAPKDADLTLAVCQSIAGDNARAAERFASALKANPDDVETIRAAAEFHIKTLDANQAKPLLDKLLDPRIKAATETTAWAKRASILLTIRSGDQRRINEAVLLIEQSLTANPLNIDDQRARAVLLTMTADRRDEGVRELETLNQKRRLGREDRFLLAKLYQERGEWPKCRELMGVLVNEPAPDGEQILAFADWMTDQGELDDAEKLLRPFQPRTPETELKLVATQCRLLQARSRTGEIPALVAAYAESHPEQTGELAFLLERFDRIPEAERAYQAYVDQEPKEPTRVLALAQFLSRQGRIDEAVALCEKASTECPPELIAPVSMLMLAQVNSPTPQLEERLGALVERSVRQKPDSASMLLNLALLRTRQQRYDEAEKLYDQILQGSPDDPRVLNNFAWLLGSRPKSEPRALELINRAIEIAGADASLLDTRALIQLKTGAVEPAIQDLTKAVTLNPRKSILHAHLAKALLMSGKPEEARQSLKRAEELGLTIAALDPLERSDLDHLRRELR